MIYIISNTQVELLFNSNFNMTLMQLKNEKILIQILKDNHPR